MVHGEYPILGNGAQCATPNPQAHLKPVNVSMLFELMSTQRAGIDVVEEIVDP